MNKLIEFQNVNFNSENKTTILKNINLCINKGEFISIVGLNGCGKSTLAKMFNGILLPSSGEVLIDKINTKDIGSLHIIRKKVGIVFQNPENQIIASTVEEEIAFGLENLCVPSYEMESKIKEVLKIVGMEGFEKKSVFSLSGGQKQRLNIASILAMNPEIIVLDEPTSMLDPLGRDSVMQLLVKFNSQYNTTIVLITHFMEEAIKSDKVIFMDSGQIKDINPPKLMFSQRKILEYVFPMQSSEILFFLKDIGYDISTSAFQTSECTNEIIKVLESQN